MKYIEFRLAEGYKEVTQKFAQDTDLKQVQDIIATYKDLVNRNQVHGNERNIDWWGKQGYQNFEKFVNAKSQQQSQTQQKKRTATGNSHTLAETAEWLIVVPLDKDASCFHGKGTDWCTTKPQHDYFEQYFRDNNVTLIYFLQKKTGAKWACAVRNGEVSGWFDINDREIWDDKFSEQTGIPVEQAMKYVAMVSDKTSDVAKKADTSRISMRDAINTTNSMIDDLKRSGSNERSIKIETLLLKIKDQELLHNYMKVIYNGKPVELDQNMQQLMAYKLPQQLSKIANITSKTLRIVIKNHPQFMTRLAQENTQATYNVMKNEPNLIPYVNDEVTYYPGYLPPQIQKLFVERDPLWLLAFSDDLDSRLEKQKDKILAVYFSKNPQLYGIVTEPGLTDLRFMQKFTKDEYDEAVEMWDDTGFEIIDRELNYFSVGD